MVLSNTKAVTRLAIARVRNCVLIHDQSKEDRHSDDDLRLDLALSNVICRDDIADLRPDELALPVRIYDLRPSYNLASSF